jgi:hypothetical protein|tara:strand:- start:922 stop:1416 length:495 start_codon:yes stop_codon:yes gene_type:complete
MALGDNTTSPARGVGARGRQPYMIQHELDFAQAATDKGTALAADDVIPGLTIPANTLILSAGFEVTEAHAGTSTNTDFDMGITGGDFDNFVDAFDLDGASVGDYGFKVGQTPILIGGTSDTIDIEIQAMTGTTTGGKIRMFAVCMNVDDQGDLTANEVDRDTLA